MRTAASRERSLHWTLALAVAALAAAPARGADGRDPRRPGPQRPADAPLPAGVAAPDFELSPLTLEKDDQGNPVGRIHPEKVRLSSFRGKRPVCIFSSSYT